MKKLCSLIIALVLVVVPRLVAADSATTTPPKALIGQWHGAWSAKVGITFKADGTWELAARGPGKPGALGKNTFAGNRITFQVTRSEGAVSDDCRGVGTYAYSFDNGGQLHFTLVSDACEWRTKAFSQPFEH